MISWFFIDIVETLNQKLNKKSNDYSRIGHHFKKKTELDIVFGNCKETNFVKTFSIIIPFYNNYQMLFRTTAALCGQTASKDYLKKKAEVILIDDGSVRKYKRINAFLRRLNNIFSRVLYLQLCHNSGRSAARNLGLLHASGDVVIFLDSDVLVPKSFIANHMIRQDYCNKCAVVGCFEKVARHNNVSDKFPNYKKDFRYKKFVPKAWTHNFPFIENSKFNKTYFLFNQSRQFKDFGNGRTIGIWQLPFMALSGNISIPRKALIKAGGFSEDFRGWGLEDAHLGAKLIALGIFIIPCASLTSYHVKLEKKTRSQEKEFASNLLKYRELLNDPLKVYSECAFLRLQQKRFARKFSVRYA